MYDLQLVVIVEFVGRQNAELVAGPEQCDRNHEGEGSWKAWFCARVRSVFI